MSIFNRMKRAWAAKSTADKIKFGLDVTCGAAGGILSTGIGNDLADRYCVTPVGKVVVKVGVSGLCLSGAVMSSNALMEAYGRPAAALIDTFKGKNEKKEEAKNA